MQPAHPVQTPLTLIMKIKSAEDFKELDGLLRGPSTHTITAALEQIGTVHFARFVFLEENTKLAVITTFDGGFDRYLQDFVDVIGDVFDALLEHMEDAPPLPCREHRREFVDYVRRNNVPVVEPFYSAYPDLKVMDIRALASDGR